MRRLQYRNHVVTLQVLDNKASAEYKCVIEEDCNCAYQLVPPGFHRRNAAERAIRTFKAHFLAILSGVDPSFSKFLWVKLLPQTELTLNLLRQSVLSLPFLPGCTLEAPSTLAPTHLVILASA